MFTLVSPVVAIAEPIGEDLLARAQAGDPEAFGELCREYEGRLFRQAFGLCRDESLAEDLAQETFVEAWRCIRRFNGKCQFFTWLCAILIHRHRNVLRRRRPTPLSVLALSEKISAVESIAAMRDLGPTPDQAVGESEQAALLRGRIEQLPERQREVIYLRFFVDDSLENIATALGCSVGTVKSRLFYGLAKLREISKQEGNRDGSTRKCEAESIRNI